METFDFESLIAFTLLIDKSGIKWFLAAQCCLDIFV